jgi:hypothetical protein
MNLFLQGPLLSNSAAEVCFLLVGLVNLYITYVYKGLVMSR